MRGAVRVQYRNNFLTMSKLSDYQIVKCIGKWHCKHVSKTSYILRQGYLLLSESGDK